MLKLNLQFVSVVSTEVKKNLLSISKRKKNYNEIKSGKKKHYSTLNRTNILVHVLNVIEPMQKLKKLLKKVSL